MREAGVGAAYDRVAEEYTARFGDQVSGDAGERWVIDRFGELCRAGGNAVIVDLGCGPGRIAAHLARSGNRVEGVDVSAEMIRIARRRSPELEFRVGSITEFLRNESPGSVGNALFWYSLIHTPPEDLGAVLASTADALEPGGHLLMGFLATDDPDGATEPYDHRVAPAHRLSLSTINRLLTNAGSTVLHLAQRAPGPGERVACGYALAVRGARAAPR